MDLWFNRTQPSRQCLAHSDFVRNFEVPGRPVLLCGWMDDWPAMKNWDLDLLRRNYRTAKFKVGEKDNGDKIRLKMVRYSADVRS